MHTDIYTDTDDEQFEDFAPTISAIGQDDFPDKLREIDNAPPQLYICAQYEDTFEKLMRLPKVAIVGSRSATPYGEQITAQLAGELAAHGVVIISGLAIGIDGIAHQAALDAGGLTMAVLPTPLSYIYPRRHTNLAHALVAAGGAIVTEYAEGSAVFKPNFVARNRIVTGLADALLITEAAVKSGTLHTARFALEQGNDVMAVPGNITSPLSEGTNNLIKSGATPVTNTADILHHLGLQPASRKGAKRQRTRGSNSQEQLIIDLLEQGVQQGSRLLEQSGLSIQDFNHHMTMLEISAKIRPLGANQWALR